MSGDAEYYNQVLSDEFENRSARNAKYSVRAFARDLGISPSLLSEVLSRKHRLSRFTGEKVAHKLSLNSTERQQFLESIQTSKRLSGSQKDATTPAYTKLDQELFQIVADWYHFVILELTYLEDFESSVPWIAKALGISKFVAKRAIDRLIRVGFLVKEHGRWKASVSHTASPSEIPSDTIKKSHHDIISKALDAIYIQSIEERDLSNIILSIDESQIPLAKKRIREFRRNFDQEFGASPRKTAAYCLAIQFFRIQAPRSGDVKLSKRKTKRSKT